MTSYSCFITGTDTEVGKTLITSSIVYALSECGVSAVGMKPIAAGSQLSEDGEFKNGDVEQILSVNPIAFPKKYIAPYQLKAATSPHIAARREHITINGKNVQEAYQVLKQQASSIIVEGVGGFMVPLSENFSSDQLALQFNLPVILVVGIRLGCINHALLTAEAILNRNLYLAGWIANCLDPKMTYTQETIATLENKILAPCLAQIPYLESQSPQTVSRLLDLSRLKHQLQRSS